MSTDNETITFRPRYMNYDRVITLRNTDHTQRIITIDFLLSRQPEQSL